LVVLLRGDIDDVVPCARSLDYADRAAAAGGDVACEALPGSGHFDVPDPLSGAWPRMLAALCALIPPPSQASAPGGPAGTAWGSATWSGSSTISGRVCSPGTGEAGCRMSSSASPRTRSAWADTIARPPAPLAQSAERLHGKEKVYGSIP
jgi:hypothetical protein